MTGALSPDDFPLPFTFDLPEGGRRFYRLGRDASYAAAERGEIPCRTIGRRKVMPTHAALQDLGWSDELIARALGLGPEHEDSAPEGGAA